MSIENDSVIQNIQAKAIEDLLARLPAEVHCFSGSDYPLPIKAALLGDKQSELAQLRQALVAGREGDVKELLEPILLAAEQCAAAQVSQVGYFLTDRQVQSHVFMGSKWQAGMVLLLGQRDQRELVAALRAHSFVVFTAQPGIADTVYLGDQPTAAIFYLQMMVRYGLVWGGIPAGADHELGHFLEKDWPGFLIITDDLPPLDYLIALGVMKLGAPAVVPATFPFPYGMRAVADNDVERVEFGSRFPNLRHRYYQDEFIRLPDYCNPALVHEAFTVGRRMGGGALDVFCLRSDGNTAQRVVVEGQPADNIGIIITANAVGLDPDIEQAVEKTALKAANYLPGIRAYRTDGVLHLDLAVGTEFVPEQLGEAVYWGIRLDYPALEHISVRLILDPAILEREAPLVKAYQSERERIVSAMTEKNTEQWCACTECRPFSLVHTCILPPDRVPMCASRSYVSIKAGARFGSPDVPWKRQSDIDLPMRLIFNKGRVLDAARGEYEGCNAVYQRLTGGQLQRVFLHSMRGFPHTSCGCFQNLAFWLDGVDGIGIMSRDADAVAPTGETWTMLANRAGGKQSPGIMGVSLPYIRSTQFLRGDGGIANLVWVDSGLYPKLQRLFLPGQKVATEQDARTVYELRAFLGR